MSSSPDATAACPAWCARSHGEIRGEEDLVHVSDSVFVRNTMIRICMTIDPDTGAQDGPYILVGAEELSLGEASTLVDVLTERLALALAATPRAAV